MKTENWKGPLVVVNEPEESVDDAEVGNSLSWKSDCFVQLEKRHGSYHIPAAKSRFSRSKDTLGRCKGEDLSWLTNLLWQTYAADTLEALQAICTQRCDMHASAP